MNLPYSVEQFGADVEQLRPRPFDTYILPIFMVVYAIRSKTGMGRWMRRILFTSGVFMGLRNWMEYKTLIADLRARLPEIQSEESGEIMRALEQIG